MMNWFASDSKTTVFLLAKSVIVVRCILTDRCDQLLFVYFPIACLFQKDVALAELEEHSGEISLLSKLEVTLC